MLFHCSSHRHKVTYRQLMSNYHYTKNEERKRLTTFLDGVKMFTDQRRRGNVTRTRREPERNVRFSSGSPPLPGSGLIQSFPLLSPLSVIPKLASCRAYQLHRERERERQEEPVQARVDRSQTLASIGETLKSTKTMETADPRHRSLNFTH
jgi:hypothetical protein